MSEVHSGTLRKSPPEHKLMRTWQKRFFILTRDKQLQYFKNEKDRRPVKDPIDLRSVTCIEASLQHKSFKHVFSINTKGRIYYLVADSHEEMEKWVEKLCEVCGFQKQDGRHSPRNSPDSSRMLRNKKAVTGHIPVGKKSSSMSPVSSVSSQSFTPQWTLSFGSPTCPLSKTMPVTKNRATSDPPEPRSHIVDYSGTRKQSLLLVQSYKQYSSSPALGTSSSIQEEYNVVPTPRPISAAPHYDLVPPPNDFDHRYSTYDVPPSQVDGGSGEFYDTVPPPRTAAHYHETYDDVPPPRPDLGYEYNYPPSNRLEVYSDVPPPRPVSDSDTYDFPPTVGINYDHVPAKRPLSSSQDVYDIVPPPRPASSDSDSLSRSENYDIVPAPRYLSHEKLPPSDVQDMYDTVPSPKMATGGYSASLPQRPISQETYDEVPPPRPSHRFHRQSSQEHYNMVAAPRCPVSSTNTINGSFNSLFSSQCSILSENIQGDRDSGLYDVPPGSVDYGYENTSRNEADSIYDVPPSKEDSDIYDVPPGHKDDIYDVPPSSRGDDIYDVPPGSKRNDIYSVPSSQADLYDFPPSSNETYDIPQSAAPQINRGAKPPPAVDRSCKPKTGQADPPYANMPPPVIRTLKPAMESIASTHSYENFPRKRPTLRKVDSLPGTPPRPQKPATVTRARSMAVRQDPIADTDYCHMVPSRSESTRLYSLTKKPIREDTSYEDMGAAGASDIRRESGYSDSTSSSSDHDDDNGQYINFENSKRGLSPPPPALPPGGPRSRKRDIEYTEVTLSFGQRNQCPIPPPRPPPISNYTTIDVDLSRGLQQTRNEKAQGTVDSQSVYS